MTLSTEPLCIYTPLFSSGKVKQPQHLELCWFSKPDFSPIAGTSSTLSLVSKSVILRCTESSLNLWVKTIMMTVLLEIFRASHSLNNVPCFVWHALTKGTLNLRGRRLWENDIFSKNMWFSSHLDETFQGFHLFILCMALPFVSAPAEKAAFICTDLCTCWSLWRSFIRQKAQQPLFFPRSAPTPFATLGATAVVQGGQAAPCRRWE